MRTVSAVPDLPAPPQELRARATAEPSALAAAVVLVVSATTVVLAAVDSRAGDDYQLHTLLLGSDLALLVLAVVAWRVLPAAVRAWRRHACALAGLALGLAMVPGLLANPSDRGVAALLRLAGVLALALAVGSVGRDGRRLVLGALAVVTLTHVVVAVAERANGGPVGLGALGEPGAHEIGGRFASTGMAVHPYVLAAWCVVAGTVLLAAWRRRSPSGGLLRVAGVAAFGAVGLTMSRAGAVAAALALAALAALLLRRRPLDRRWLLTVAAAGVALAAGVVANLSGWISRAGQGGDVTSGRGDLLRQAWPLLGDHLLAGVGPGNYVLALSERPELVALSVQSPRPVHVTPLLLVVEGGLLVVPALLLLALAVARACARGGAATVAVTLAMVPFLALDHLAWTFPQGLVLTGVWLGALDLLSQRDEPVAAGR